MALQQVRPTFIPVSTRFDTQQHHVRTCSACHARIVTFLFDLDVTHRSFMISMFGISLSPFPHSSFALPSLTYIHTHCAVPTYYNQVTSVRVTSTGSSTPHTTHPCFALQRSVSLDLRPTLPFIHIEVLQTDFVVVLVCDR